MVKSIDYKKKKKKIIPWLIVGILIALGPVWGLVITIMTMIASFNTLAEADSTAEALANEVSFSLYASAIGWIIMPFGILIAIIAIIKLNRAKKELNLPISSE